MSKIRRRVTLGRIGLRVVRFAHRTAWGSYPSLLTIKKRVSFDTLFLW